MSVTEQEVKEVKVEKSGLAKAYELKRALKLDLTAEQFIQLNDIMCNLSTEEFKRGLDKGFEICEKYRR